MKIGDYVIKIKGRHKGATGLITEIIRNDAKNTILEVLVNGEPIYWPAQLVKRFKQEKQ